MGFIVENYFSPLDGESNNLADVYAHGVSVIFTIEKI